MARWCLSPIIGDGTAPNSRTGQGPYRLKAGEYGAHVSLIQPETEPNWGLCIFYDETDISGDPDLDVFPPYPFEQVLTNQERVWLANRLNQRGIDNTWLYDGITVGECIEAIGQMIDPTFNLGWFRYP